MGENSLRPYAIIVVDGVRPEVIYTGEEVFEYGTGDTAVYAKTHAVANRIIWEKITEIGRQGNVIWYQNAINDVLSAWYHYSEERLGLEYFARGSEKGADTPEAEGILAQPIAHVYHYDPANLVHQGPIHSSIDCDGPIAFKDCRAFDCRIPKVCPGLVLPCYGDVTIEYALWADVEIGHVYELEHVWVHLAKIAGDWRLSSVSGSAHGDVIDVSAAGVNAEGRPLVFSEPGKHGMSGSHEKYECTRELLNVLCGAAAGTMGVHIPADAAPDVAVPSAGDHRRAWNLLREHRFTPNWDSGLEVPVSGLTRWRSWQELRDARPGRVRNVLVGLNEEPARVSVGDWGSATEAWVVAATAHGDGIRFDDRVTLEVINEGLTAGRMLVIVVEDPTLVLKARRALWEGWASSTSLIVSSGYAEGNKVAYPNSGGLAGGWALGEPRADSLGIGPGNDFDAPLSLLREHGLSSM